VCVLALTVMFAVAYGRPLLSAAEAAGSLLVESDPAGASVYVDGRLAGQTPLTLPTVAAGVHRVRLVRLGFLEHSRRVTIKAGIRATLRSRLTAPRAENASAQAALRIVVIDGEGAVNIIRQKTATAPVVEVRDQNDLPVAGVPVTFSISGSGASFGGSSTLTVVTNGAGRAAAAGLTPTSSGALQIGVSAAFQGQTAAATIAQLNVMTAAQAASASAAAAGSGGAAGGGGISGTTLSILGVAAAGGAVATARAVGGGTEAPALVTDSFMGFTQVFPPQLSFSAVRSTPPFTIREAQTVTVTVRYTAPADCFILLYACAAIADRGFAGCIGGTAHTGAAGSGTFTENLQAGTYNIALGLSTGPVHGPLCLAFSGNITFSGTATHR